jgi:Histidine phosphatase superfamily (branch 1)
MIEYQQFIVIRHGESQTNATDTFQAGNQYDSDPLTPLGAADAGRLAERLAALPVDLIVSSSYLRARSTAARIAEATGAPHVIPVRQGSTWTDLAADDPRSATMSRSCESLTSPASCRGWGFQEPRARAIQPAALAVADQPHGHYSDAERTSTTCGGGQRRSAGTSRRGRND